MRPHHVRWTLHPALPWPLAALLLAALTVLARHPDRFPGYRALVWSSHGSLVLAVGAAAGWTLLLLHELAHLACARAAGVPARIRLGTRLQFLVVQTDISGIELAPRRHRLTAYLAGTAVNLATAATAFLLLTATHPGTTAHRILAALVLLALLPLPFQLLLFTRTDLYFVLQDLTGCRDLYGDGRAYARHLARRAARRPTRDPSRTLPPRERRAVRLYSAVLVLGTALCVAVALAVTVPADLVLLGRAVTGLGPGHSAAQRADAATVLLVVGGAQLLWAVTKWRGRRSRRK